VLLLLLLLCRAARRVPASLTGRLTARTAVLAAVPPAPRCSVVFAARLPARPRSCCCGSARGRRRRPLFAQTAPDLLPPSLPPSPRLFSSFPAPQVRQRLEPADGPAGHGPRAPHRPEEGGAGLPLLHGDVDRGEGEAPARKGEHGACAACGGRWPRCERGARRPFRPSLACTFQTPHLFVRFLPTRHAFLSCPHPPRPQVIEKAYKKLRLDALVIQQGRLVENTKGVNKDDLLSMVRAAPLLLTRGRVSGCAGCAVLCCVCVCVCVCVFVRTHAAELLRAARLRLLCAYAVPAPPPWYCPPGAVRRRDGLQLRGDQHHGAGHRRHHHQGAW
jgi:hypothetical protein